MIRARLLKYFVEQQKNTHLGIKKSDLTSEKNQKKIIDTNLCLHGKDINAFEAVQILFKKI
jgi:hypothetical protein